LAAQAQVGQSIGLPLEDFSLQRVGGGMETLSQYLINKKGGIVLFWSGVCSHCGRYDAYFNSFAEQHPDLGFVAVAPRQNETVEMIRKTCAHRKLTFPILYDPDGRLAGRWFAQQTPRVYLLDSNRTLLYRGAIDNFKYPGDSEYVAYLEPAISQFLAGEPQTRVETASFGCDIRSVYYILPKAL
jgi:peroxiredoxin